MKKSTLILSALIICAFLSKAQIPNNGFETWTTVGSYENPTDWATMNASCAGPFYSCTKSTDHYPTFIGNYSVRVENNTSLTQSTGGWGMVVTDTMAYPFEPAFPLVGTPTNLCGYYKYNSLNSDSMFIRIVFFHNHSLLGYDTFITGISTNWTSFILPLTDYPTADSATLMFSAFWPNGPYSGPKGNSVLYVDNLSFDTFINVPMQSVNNPTFNVYPNPVSDELIIEMKSNLNTLNFEILNSVGQVVYKGSMTEKVKVPTENLTSGIYTIKLENGKSFEFTKVIKK